jgi:hypothetical protein
MTHQPRRTTLGSAAQILYPNPDKPEKVLNTKDGLKTFARFVSFV